MTRPSYEATTNTTSPVIPPPDPGGEAGLVEVFCTAAVRTSAGPLIGPKRVPPAEASALVAAKVAIYGPNPPAGYNLWPG